MDQLGYAFLLALVVIPCNIQRSCFLIYLVSISGNHTEANSEMPPTISSTLRDEDVTILKTLNDYDGTQPTSKCVAPLTPLQQSGIKYQPKRWLYHVPLGTPVIHKLSPKWTKNEEVLHCLKDDVKPPSSIKEEMPSRINGLIKVFCNTHYSVPPQKKNSRTMFQNLPKRLAHHHVPMVLYHE